MSISEYRSGQPSEEQQPFGGGVNRPALHPPEREPILAALPERPAGWGAETIALSPDQTRTFAYLMYRTMFRFLDTTILDGLYVWDAGETGSTIPGWRYVERYATAHRLPPDRLIPWAHHASFDFATAYLPALEGKLREAQQVVAADPRTDRILLQAARERVESAKRIIDQGIHAPIHTDIPN